LFFLGIVSFVLFFTDLKSSILLKPLPEWVNFNIKGSNRLAKILTVLLHGAVPLLNNYGDGIHRLHGS
jgi:hypothetical protein